MTMTWQRVARGLAFLLRLDMALGVAVAAVLVVFVAWR
jgi:hypothetical protein